MNPETAPSTPPQPQQPSEAAADLRPALWRAFAQAERVIASVTSDQLTRPTPCIEWDVRELRSHLVKAARRIAAVGEGRPAMEVPSEPIPDDRVLEAFHGAREAAERAWSVDAAMTREAQVPWGRVPGAATLGIYLPEVVTHTWDLWTAIDSTVPLDAELARAALAAAARTIPVARDGFPFGPVVEVPATADPYSRLAGWMGRRPDWRHAAGAE